MTYKICKKSVMDNTDPSISFDENGICSHCRNFSTKTLPNWDKLLSNKNGLNKLKDEFAEIKTLLKQIIEKYNDYY